MDHEQFIQRVARGIEADREAAERATVAVLQTLAERIVGGEADDLASELPAELAPALSKRRPEAEPFDVDEFLRRVAEREGVDPKTAERHALTVFTVLGQAVSPKELSDILAELPKDYRYLLPRGPSIEVPAFDDLIARVSERGGLDDHAARRALEAVLETLAEQIAPGEVDDMIADLPIELHPVLKQARARNGRRKPVAFDEFIARVAEREGVTFEQAFEHARAVLATLRDALGEDFYDITAQLPGEYDRLLTPA